MKQWAGLIVFVRLLFLCLVACCLFAQDDQPQLLLTTKRLRRLRLDAQRQTERWVNFEHRVKTVLNSPERGFELALYSVVSGDAAACAAAAEWSTAHPSEWRQNALVADWCPADFVKLEPAVRERLLTPSSGGRSSGLFEMARDQLFASVVKNDATRDGIRTQWNELLKIIQDDPRRALPEAYPLFEYLDVVDKRFRLDLRESDPRLFTILPSLFLLSLNPAQLEKPDWKVRAGGLMMVNLDSNLQAAAFVQGWAMEDPKMARDGAGVAYEFLWANPYLPGLGYYNMEPWTYIPESGLLLARKSWDSNACSVSWYKGGVNAQHCPADLLSKPAAFGKLNVIPVNGNCVDVPPQRNQATILTGLKPGGTVAWRDNREKFAATADPGGLLEVSTAVSGKLCKVDNNKQSRL